MLLYFFFQAEDGIRDRNVTGVQTCALPICINQVDSKHDNKHYDLKLLVHTFMESQKPLNTTLQSIDGKMETLNTTMAGYKDRLVDMEYKQSDQDKRLSGIEEAQKGKKEHNTRILIALIGAVSTL